MNAPGAEVRHADCLPGMMAMEASTVDAIVTDPPYGLGFMGKDWDHGVPGPHFWEEALRVAKPGAHLLAFGGTRTFHRLTVAIEDAGWEVRDCLCWLYGSGFPKSLNLRNVPAMPVEWEGWGTALKPAWEPIILARKPLQGTVAANVLEHGTGALNVDGCRLPTSDKLGGCHVSSRAEGWNRPWKADPEALERNKQRWAEADAKANALGRWPANVAMDEEAAAAVDAQSGELTSGANPTRALMRWLCRLVTPPGGLVLDPFAGSGSTGSAAVLEGFRFLGFENVAEYAEIARRRVAHSQRAALLQQPELFERGHTA